MLEPGKPLAGGNSKFKKTYFREGLMLLDKEHYLGPSLVAQWWRICLPVQKTWVRSLIRRIPHAMEPLDLCAATKPVLWSRGAATAGSSGCSPWGPPALRPVLRGETPWPWGACAPPLESGPRSIEDPAQPKVK